MVIGDTARRLQILMPMAGLGSRFAKEGFRLPKPLIDVDGTPMFRKAISSIQAIHADKSYYFVIRQEHVDSQGLDKLIVDALPEAHVIVIPEMTRGAAETAYLAKASLDPNDALVLMDCDLWFQSANYNQMVEDILSGASDIAGGVLTFTADNPRYSYAKFGADHIVTETAEKRVISEHAMTGAYFFAAANEFVRVAEALLRQPLTDKMPEYYISFLYNILIDEGKKIQAAIVDEFASFGTPEELADYNRSQTAQASD
jgi:dTDP-glucose pyrophosphorylase